MTTAKLTRNEERPKYIPNAVNYKGYIAINTHNKKEQRLRPLFDKTISCSNFMKKITIFVFCIIAILSSISCSNGQETQIPLTVIQARDSSKLDTVLLYTGEEKVYIFDTNKNYIRTIHKESKTTSDCFIFIVIMLFLAIVLLFVSIA